MTVKPLNILFSTTRNWNAGDDFILFGIINLFKSLINCNPFIYNRNPSLHGLRTIFNREVDLKKGDSYEKINFYSTLKPYLPHYDNSWSEQLDIDLFDLVVFAGTPEWLGGMVQPLVQAIIQKNIPTMYLGIGSFEGIAQLTLDKIPPHDRILLEKAELITVRDKICQQILAPLSTELLPCPALFAAQYAKPSSATEIKQIGFTLQGTQANNGQHISKEVFNYASQLLKLIKQHYACGLICHYINELAELKSLAEDIPIYYSYDAKDYLALYKQFDLLITTRVHGAGLCASLGIPSFVIVHSIRSDTVTGFLAEIIAPHSYTPEQVLQKIQNYHLSKIMLKLSAHKQKTFMHYQQLLQPIFKKLGFII